MANQRILYRAFQDIDGHLDDLYSIYASVYHSVPTIHYEERLHDRYSFDYCKGRRYFVLVIPYTDHREVLVERSFANNQLSWVLVGGSLRHDLVETFIDAANRHVSRTIANLELGEIEPIAFLNNCFMHNGNTHYHRGIAFIARIRNNNPKHDLRATIHSRGHFVPYDDTSIPFSLLHNDALMDVVRKYLQNHDIDSAPEFEISENVKYQRRYAFHNAVVKPLFRFAGRFLFPDSIPDLDKNFIHLIQQGSHERGLDVACGENTAVIQFAKFPGVELVVGNDISWSQIQLMSKQLAGDKFRDIDSYVLFTNHDARHLPFTDRYFDFVICKNVLHHMEDLASVRCLLQEVIRVSKRAIIIEIMDPHFESLWGVVRHQYYMNFLHDAGRHFLSRCEFVSLTDTPERTETFEMRTIRGVYQFALFSNPGEGEGVAPLKEAVYNQPTSIGGKL